MINEVKNSLVSDVDGEVRELPRECRRQPGRVEHLQVVEVVVDINVVNLNVVDGCCSC